jgi:addiction module HigA family antidote
VALPPSHPGETLAEELAARGLTAHALALKLRVPANRITDIVRGRRAISAETALRLGRYFGTGAKFWVDLQVSHDLAVRGAGSRPDHREGGRSGLSSLRSRHHQSCTKARQADAANVK